MSVVQQNINRRSNMRIIQLEPHALTRLPHHPDLQGEAETPDLQGFIRATLDEARPLLHQFPSSLKADRNLRSSPPSGARIQLSQGWRTLPTSEGSKPKKEFWVCRQSEHQDSNRTYGTVSWWEFQDGLRDNHAEHEMEYTPSVKSVHQLLKWNESSEWNPHRAVVLADKSYNHFNVELNLIVHTFNPQVLIRPRAFISWTMSANFSDAYATTERGSEEAQRAAEGFVTIQVPFALPRSMTPGSQFEGLFTRVMDAVPPRTIFASYASVERAELFLPAPSSSVSPASVADVDEANALHGRRIRWTMATTSDAGGNIPKWVQRNWTLGGVPRAVVADVGLFIDWTMKRRERRRLEDDAQVEEV